MQALRLIIQLLTSPKSIQEKELLLGRIRYDHNQYLTFQVARVHYFGQHFKITWFHAKNQLLRNKDFFLSNEDVLSVILDIP